jgi:ribosome-associated toxin RatA of RatAB toxin-antitoxin module
MTASHIRRRVVVADPPERMFALVNDVESYPQFLPHCRAARVLRRGEGEIEARIELAKGALHKAFTTRNRLDPPHRIQMQLVDGPFRRLQGAWVFTDLGPQGTAVELDLEFEFSNRLVAIALGPVFHQLANSLVDAFVLRARSLRPAGHG